MSQFKDMGLLVQEAWEREKKLKADRAIEEAKRSLISDTPAHSAEKTAELVEVQQQQHQKAFEQAVRRIAGPHPFLQGTQPPAPPSQDSAPPVRKGLKLKSDPDIERIENSFKEQVSQLHADNKLLASQVEALTTTITTFAEELASARTELSTLKKSAAMTTLSEQLSQRSKLTAVDSLDYTAKIRVDNVAYSYSDDELTLFYHIINDGGSPSRRKRPLKFCGADIQDKHAWAALDQAYRTPLDQLTAGQVVDLYVKGRHFPKGVIPSGFSEVVPF